MEIDTEKYRQYVTPVLAVMLVLSFGYTFTVSQKIDSQTKPSEVKSIVDEKQKPIINEFDSVVKDLNGDIDSVNSTVISYENDFTSLNSSIESVREKNSQLKEDLDQTKSDLVEAEKKLKELRSWAEGMAEVKVTSVSESSNPQKQSH